MKLTLNIVITEQRELTHRFTPRSMLCILPPLFNATFRDQPMLEQVLEFVVNHWLLTGIWIVLFFVLIRTEGARGGKALSTLEATQMINKEDAKVVDLRSKDEFRSGHLPDAIHIPAKDMPKRVTELDAFKEQPVILICKTGATAGATGMMMAKSGFTQLYKLQGGILEWQSNKLPLIKG